LAASPSPALRQILRLAIEQYKPTALHKVERHIEQAENPQKVADLQDPMYATKIKDKAM
jgi:hypothetical protein